MNIKMACVMAVSLSVTASSFAQSEYQYFQLDGPGGAEFRPRAINDQGVVVGEIDTPDGFRAAMWTAQSGVILLDQITEPAVPTGINNSNQIVGSFVNNSDSALVAFSFDGNTLTEMPPLNGDEASGAVGVSENGHVLVTSGFVGREPDMTFSPTALLISGTTILDQFPGLAPNAISPDGILALARGGQDFLLINGTEFPLPDPPGRTSARVEDVNDLGIAAGVGRIVSSGFSSETQAIYWDANQNPIDIPIPNPGGFGRSNGINNRGQIVGASDGQAFAFDIGGSAFFLDNATQGLPSGTTLREAFDVNESGVIVGIAQDGPDFFRDVVGFALIPRLGSNYCSSTPNSTGEAAEILATGSTRVTDQDLSLIASPVPSGAGIFLVGTNPTRVPLGDGLLCVIDNLVLLPSGTSAEREVAVLNLDSLPDDLAGLDLYFQYAFFDQGRGGALNFSDAVELSFTL